MLIWELNKKIENKQIDVIFMLRFRGDKKEEKKPHTYGKHIYLNRQPHLINLLIIIIIVLE